MSGVTTSRIQGKAAELDSAAVDGLKAAVRGEVILPQDESYDEARSIWNAMIDRRPALIVRCQGVADVQWAVRFAREHKLLTAVRSGGHNVAGRALCDSGLVIDLSGMRSVRIDPDARRAHVEPGATLGDVDHESQNFGLATPVGINSTTGIAGLTLGGGFGWISRKYGMTVDALRAADVVTADGEFLRASERDNPDLFWAIRGGGGNFGIVTRFEYELYPVGPEVLAGLIVFSHDEAASTMKQYRDLVKTLGDETTLWTVLREAPPLPFLPEDVHGSNIIAYAICHIGDPAEGDKILDKIRGFGTVLGEHVGKQPFTSWQQAFDPLLTPGARNYWKSHNYDDLEDGLIDTVVQYAGNLPSPQCEIFFGSLGKAVNRVAPDATAYPYRTNDYIMNVHGRWDEASDDDKCVGWAREFFEKATPFATGGVYINFLTDDEDDRVGAAFGSNYQKLTELKKKYDPDNFFRVNMNISPDA
jgi:FAD/FMN-containing dehydrogenase